MQNVAKTGAAVIGIAATIVGFYAAVLWLKASQARVEFKVGEKQVIGGGNLAVEITKLGVINPQATADLSNSLNAKAAFYTACAIALQAVATGLDKLG